MRMFQFCFETMKSIQPGERVAGLHRILPRLHLIADI
jgi:hypothetical protein